MKILHWLRLIFRPNILLPAKPDWRRHLIPELAKNVIVSVSVIVTDDGRTHTTVSCGKGRGFGEVLRGVISAREGMEEQIALRSKCPFNPKPSKKN